MNETIDILNNLETVFESPKAKAITSAIIKQDSETHANLVEKQDLLLTKIELQNEIQAVRTDLTNEIQSVRTELTNKIESVESRLTHEIQSVKKDLQIEIRDFKINNNEQMGQLHEDMYKNFAMIYKSINRMTIYFISALGIIATVFKLIDYLMKP